MNEDAPRRRGRVVAWLNRPDTYPRWFTVLVIFMGVASIPDIIEEIGRIF